MGMLHRPNSFVCQCPLVTDVSAPLPCPSLVEKSETSDLGLPAQARRSSSPAATRVSLQTCFFAAKPWRNKQMGEGSLGRAQFRKQGVCTETQGNASVLQAVGSQLGGSAYILYRYMYVCVHKCGISLLKLKMLQSLWRAA